MKVLYYDSNRSPCACLADRIAIVAYRISRPVNFAPEGTAAATVIRPRQRGAGFKYTISLSAIARLGPMNKDLDPRGRYDAVMAADGLYQQEPAP